MNNDNINNDNMNNDNMNNNNNIKIEDDLCSSISSNSSDSILDSLNKSLNKNLKKYNINNLNFDENINNTINNSINNSGNNNINNKENKKKRKHTGVGVLILTNYKNKPHLLLGREWFKSKKEGDDYLIELYEEFGGGKQSNKVSLEENACFELKEETCNLLNFSNANILKKGFNHYFDIPFKNDRMYRLYVIYIKDVDIILKYFDMNYTILSNKKSNYYKFKNYLEMNKLQLISLYDIRNNIGHKSNYISFYPEDSVNNQKITFNNINNLTYYQKKSLTGDGNYYFQGVLKLKSNIYISKRLICFLSSTHIYNNHIMTGFKACLKMYKDVNDYLNNLNNENENKNTQHKYENITVNTEKVNKKYYNIINLTNPYLNTTQNNKLNFLSGTWSINAY